MLQAFLNSYYDLAGGDGADLFATPTQLRAWMSDRGLLAARAQISPAARERAVAVRDGLRELIAGRSRRFADPSGAHTPLNKAIAGASLELRLMADRPELVPVGSSPLDRALGALLATAVVAMIDGTWLRLKVCPGPHCGWVFYDHSRNNSSRWCSMKVCGGRVKSRAHYQRHREH